MKTTLKDETSPQLKKSGTTSDQKAIALVDGTEHRSAVATDNQPCTSVEDWLRAAKTNPKSIQNVWLVCRPGPDDQALLGTVEATGHEAAKVVARSRWPQWAAYLHASSAAGVSKVHQKYLHRLARDPFPLAFHEAGHAITGRHFGATIWSVDIVPRMLSANRQFSPYGTSLGTTTIYRPTVGRTKKEQRREAEQTMVYVLAGTAAEAKYRPGRNHRNSDESDMASIMSLLCQYSLGEVELYLKGMKTRAKELVIQHWADIQTVANALVDRRELTGGDIDSLLADRLAA